MIVQVRVVSDVPKATLVTIEPLTEDDWEVLELNSEHAEADILNQVLHYSKISILPFLPSECSIADAQVFCCKCSSETFLLLNTG